MKAASRSARAVRKQIAIHLFLSISIPVLIFASAEIAPAGTPPTVDELIQTWERTERLVFESESFLLHYERTASVDLLPSVRGGRLPAEWKLGRRGASWSLERRFTKPFTDENVAVAAEPKRVVARDGFLLDLDGGQKNASLNPFDFGGNLYAGLDYTQYVGLNAPKFILRSNEADGKIEEARRGMADYIDLPFLPDFVRANKKRYHVDTSPAIIDGRETWHVHWPEVDELWVDPERALIFLRRRYHWAPGQPLQDEVFASDFREVKPDVWLPFSLRVDHYASVAGDSKEKWNNVVARSTYRVHAIEFGRLPSDFFDIQLPVGTHVFDMVRDLNYTVTGNSDMEPFAIPLKEGRAQLRRTSGFWIVLNFLLVVTCLLLIARYRWRRRLRPEVRDAGV